MHAVLIHRWVAILALPWSGQRRAPSHPSTKNQIHTAKELRRLQFHYTNYHCGAARVKNIMRLEKELRCA
jgi:hypothetical protein